MRSLGPNQILHAAVEGVSGQVQSHNPEAPIADGAADATDGSIVIIPHRILLTSLDTPADLVTDVPMLFAGKFIGWYAVAEVVATSGGTADADLAFHKGASAVAGTLTEGLTQANFDAIGEYKKLNDPTTPPSFDVGDTYSIVCPESAVNFTAGVIIVYLVFAMAPAKVNAILTALRANKQINT